MSDPVTSFLQGSGFAGWQRQTLAGDASTRSYERLTGPDGQTAILMQTPDPADSFARIGQHLASVGLCPPRTLLAAPNARMMVIEDLGPQHFAQWLALHPGDEDVLYGAAVDVLVDVQKAAPPSGLVALTPAHAAAMISPLVEWYAPNAPLDELTSALEMALRDHAARPDCLALRDFHAENLIWRPDKTGTDRVGLLDYQDAVLAPAEYDLVSLLRDARRDVSDALAERMTARFARLTGRDPDCVRAASACLGVQRNLRILGIFARLARCYGKPRYLGLMPRVWGHIQTDLAHPAMAGLAPLIAAHIPPPERAGLP